MVSDLTQMLAWWNVGFELCYLLDCQSTEILRTLLFLFDKDLEEGFLKVSKQNYCFKSCSNQGFPQFVLKRWPLFQRIVKRIPRLWFDQDTCCSQFCLLCILPNYWPVWQEKFFLDFDFGVLKPFLSRYLLTDLGLPDHTFLKFPGFIWAVLKVASGLPDSQICCCLKELCSQSTRDLPRTSTPQPLHPPPPPHFSQAVFWIYYTTSHKRSKSLTDVLVSLHKNEEILNVKLLFLCTVYSELTKSFSLPRDIMTQPILYCSAIGSFNLPTIG